MEYHGNLKTFFKNQEIILKFKAIWIFENTLKIKTITKLKKLKWK